MQTFFIWPMLISVAIIVIVALFNVVVDCSKITNNKKRHIKIITFTVVLFMGNIVLSIYVSAMVSKGYYNAILQQCREEKKIRRSYQFTPQDNDNQRLNV